MSDNNASEGVAGGVDMKFIMQALTSEVQRMFRAELEQFHERVEQSFEHPRNPPTARRRERLPRRGERVDEEEYDGGDFENENVYDSGVSNRRYGGRHREDRNREDNNLGNIKMKIPSFQGKNDPEAYLEWERNVELVFDCHHYSENKKVKLAVIEFSDYAIVWWDQLVLNKRRNREPSVETWEEMKRVMRKRFVPTYYYRDLYNKLQNLRQGNRSVKEYYKEMKVAMTRANIEEDREPSMARFLAGLNRQIQKVVELAHYVELENMVDMAIKIENQVKRRDSTNTRSEPSPISSTWKLNQWRKEDKPPNGNPKIEQEEEVTRQGNQDHESDCDSRPSLEDVDDKEYAVQGELMVARRALSVQAKEDDEVQRENIFHTRCHVQNKEFKYVIPEDDPGDLPPKEAEELQSQVEEFISPCVIHVLLDPKKDGPWRICIYFHAINNIMVKIRGRIFSRKGGMMKIKAQRIRDDGGMAKEWSADPLEIPRGPITRARAKRFKEALNVLIQDSQAEGAHGLNSKKETKLVHVINVNPNFDQELRRF